jgi:acyl-CoA hydrolase
MPAETISADRAASFVKSGMWLDYGATLCEPDVFDKALARRKDELENVKIRTCLSVRPRAVIEEDPEGRHFHLFSWHFSTYERRKHDAGRCNYSPLNLGEVPDYYRRFLDPVDIVILQTCPMDEGGYFNFGPTNFWQRAIIERAHLVIVEINRAMPYVFGKENGVHISEVDFIIEGDHQPCAELPNPEPSEIDRTVAARIAAEVEDGACLQIGIGGMPNAVCALLMDSGVKDLGIHTEMLTDGLGLLYRSGQVTGLRKALDPGKVVYTFALGSLALYATTSRNPHLYCHQVDYTNSPHIIMQNDKVVSINNTTQIDLQGQAASESDGYRHISGTGGQLQFVRGAYASKGGKSFLCLSSTFEKRGERRSRIVFTLTPGNIVTTPRSDVMYVVTEFGMVNLKGRCVAERAKAIISLAHPDFREDLERQAYEHRLIPRGVSFSSRGNPSDDFERTSTLVR